MVRRRTRLRDLVSRAGAPPDPGAELDRTELHWTHAGPGSLYRVLLRDETENRVALKDTVVGPPFVIDWKIFDSRHSFRWRVQRKEGDTWVDHDDPRYREVVPPLGAVLGARRKTPDGALDPSLAGQSLLLFTVDTEAGTSQMRVPDRRLAVSEHVFGDFGDGRRLGVDLHMDLLEHAGVRGCFFVDILLEHQFGRHELERVIEAILSRGHEIQLHLHTHHLGLSDDRELRQYAGALYGDDEDPFRHALSHAVELFEKRVGHAPSAYRSGGYNICDAFLRVLPEFGIAIDSSLNPFKNCRVSPWMRTRTQPFRVGELLEIPVSWMAVEQNGLCSVRQLSPYRSIAATPFVERVRDNVVPVTSVYVSHSYQLLESHREAEKVYFGPEADEARVDLLARLLVDFVSQPRARGATFGEIQAGMLQTWDGPADWPVDPLPTLLESGQSTTLHLRRTPSRLPHARTARRGPLMELIGGLATEWQGATLLAWCAEHQDESLAELGASVRSVAGPDAADVRSALEEVAPMDGAVVVDALELVPPDDLVGVLVVLHDALRPGGRMVLRVRTDIIDALGSREGRACAATYMTALRRAGFAFDQVDRILADGDDLLDPDIVEKVRFYDELEARTLALDVVAVRPDRTLLSDLTLADR